MKNAYFRDKKVTVVGLAASGLAASLLLKRLGAEVWVTDSSLIKQTLKNARQLQKKSIRNIELGTHSAKFIKDKDLIVVSPGVSNKAKPIIWAKKYKIPVISEIELGSLACPAPIIAVTGSNGKSTVTTLVGEIFKKAGFKTFVCGNIGLPFSGQVSRIGKNSVVVLEVSSFQLEYIDKFKPKAGIILNVTPNHLDRYKNFNEYIKAKWRIFKNQDENDFAILNYDDVNLKKLSRDLKSKVLFFSSRQKADTGYLKNDFIYFKNKKFFPLKDIKIKGRHNLENIMAGVSAAKIFGISDKIIKQVLKTFKGLEHRIEYVKTFGGIDFINDSKSTSVGATLAALNCFSKPVVLIAGGRDKGSDFSPIRRLIPKRIKGLVLVGEAKEKIREAIKDLTAVEEAVSFPQAVKKAYQMAIGGEVVLLSPMCASFDMFRNFEHRGEVFKKIVRAIKN